MKKILFLLFALCSLGLHADDLKWCIVADSGQKMLMGNVGFLLASDDADTFAIVGTDGTVLNNVRTATFAQADAAAIAPVHAGEPALYAVQVAGCLRLMGLAEGSEIHIYAANGQEAYRQQATSSDCEVPVGQLSRGVYVLQAGRSTVKFMKK